MKKRTWLTVLAGCAVTTAFAFHFATSKRHLAAATRPLWRAFADLVSTGPHCVWLPIPQRGPQQREKFGTSS